jgi:hypothetical protein
MAHCPSHKWLGYFRGHHYFETAITRRAPLQGGHRPFVNPPGNGFHAPPHPGPLPQLPLAERENRSLLSGKNPSLRRANASASLPNLCRHPPDASALRSYVAAGHSYGVGGRSAVVGMVCGCVGGLAGAVGGSKICVGTAPFYGGKLRFYGRIRRGLKIFSTKCGTMHLTSVEPFATLET